MTWSPLQNPRFSGGMCVNWVTIRVHGKKSLMEVLMDCGKFSWLWGARWIVKSWNELFLHRMLRQSRTNPQQNWSKRQNPRWARKDFTMQLIFSDLIIHDEYSILIKAMRRRWRQSLSRFWGKWKVSRKFSSLVKLLKREQSERRENFSVFVAFLHFVQFSTSGS